MSSKTLLCNINEILLRGLKTQFLYFVGHIVFNLILHLIKHFYDNVYLGTHFVVRYIRYVLSDIIAVSDGNSNSPETLYLKWCLRM